MQTEPQRGGHLYLQTNELRNTVVHYRWDADGRLTESERQPTGGGGAGDFTYRTQPTGPLTEGANSVLVTPDRGLLFAVNAGDNSVSSFGVDAEGRLALQDVRRTGNIVTRIVGTAKSLDYAPSCRTLYVLHLLGPEHIRPMAVEHGGSLVAPPLGILDRAARQTGSRSDDGRSSVGEPSFQDAGGGSPWCPVFLNGRPNEFLLGFATADPVSLASIGDDGVISTGPAVPADTSMGRPSELCWMAVTPDDHLVFATMTGYGYITSWRLSGKVTRVAIPHNSTQGLAGF